MNGSIKSIPRFWILSYMITFLLPMLLLCLSFLGSDYYWKKDVQKFYKQAGISYTEISDDLFRKVEMLELELGWDKRSSRLSHLSDWGAEDFYELISLQTFLKNSLVSRPFLEELLLYFPEQDKILTKNGLYEGQEFIRLFSLADEHISRNLLRSSINGESSRKILRLPKGRSGLHPLLVLIRRFPLNSSENPKLVVISFLNEEHWKKSFRSLLNDNKIGGTFRVSAEGEEGLSFTEHIPEKIGTTVRLPSSVLEGEYIYTFPPPGRYGNYRLARILGLTAMLLCLIGGSVFTAYSVLRNLRQIGPIYRLVSYEGDSPQLLRRQVEGILKRNEIMSSRLERLQLLQMICGNTEIGIPELEKLLPHECNLICHWKGDSSIAFPSPEEGLLFEWFRFSGDESLLLWNGPATARTANLTSLESSFRRCGISAGCSLPIEELEQLPLALDQAREASAFSRLRGDGGLLTFDSEAGVQRLPGTKGTLKLVDIRRHIKSCEWSSARRDIRLYMECLREPGLSTSMVRIQTYALLAALADGLGQLRTSDETGLAEQIDGLFRDFENAGRLTDIEKAVLLLLKELETPLSQETPGAAGPWTNQVSSYMKVHYADSSLSVQGMAEELGTTASYLSSVFRRENTSGLLTYIHRERLRRSLPLLAEGKRPIKEIAVAVGFTGSNSYIRSFRKYLGITPGNFRALSDDEKWAINEKMEDSPFRES